MSSSNRVTRIGQGNSMQANLAFATFQSIAFNRIVGVEVPWAQARRFARTVEKSDFKKAIRFAHEIDPKVGQTAEEAEQTDSPEEAFDFLARLLKVSAVGATIVGFVLTTIHIVEEVTGREFHEIFEQLSNEPGSKLYDDPEDEQVKQGEQNPDDSRDQEGQQKPPRGPNKPIDV